MMEHVGISKLSHYVTRIWPPKHSRMYNKKMTHLLIYCFLSTPFILIDVEF